MFLSTFAFCISFEPKVESLRWNILPQEWKNADYYLKEGTYFKIPFNLSEEISPNIRGLKVYSKPSLTSEVILEILDDSMFLKKGQVVCENQSVDQKYFSSYVKCGSGFCDKKEKDDFDKVRYRSPLNSKLFAGNDDCPYKIDFFTHHVKPEVGESSHYFSSPGTTPDQKFLQITVSGKPAFLDISKCKDNECRFEKFEKSRLEEKLNDLKIVKKEKSHKILNGLIANLLPCVKKSNIECIKKYFRSERDDAGLGKQEITKEIINELKACLRYESLLAHLQASKGIRKICIFGDSDQMPSLISVSYPEALFPGAIIYVED